MTPQQILAAAGSNPNIRYVGGIWVPINEQGYSAASQANAAASWGDGVAINRDRANLGGFAPLTWDQYQSQNYMTFGPGERNTSPTTFGGQNGYTPNPRLPVPSPFNLPLSVASGNPPPIQGGPQPSSPPPPPITTPPTAPPPTTPPSSPPPSSGGLLGGWNIRTLPSNIPSLASTVGTNPMNPAGSLWNLGGNFQGTARPPFAIQGYDNWNPNDPRVASPGLVQMSGNRMYMPRQLADLYGAGIRNPFANAFQQYGQAMAMSNPILPSFPWARRTTTPSGGQ